VVHRAAIWPPCSLVSRVPSPCSATTPPLTPAARRGVWPLRDEPQHIVVTHSKPGSAFFLKADTKTQTKAKAHQRAKHIGSHCRRYLVHVGWCPGAAAYHGCMSNSPGPAFSAIALRHPHLTAARLTPRGRQGESVCYQDSAPEIPGLLLCPLSRKLLGRLFGAFPRAGEFDLVAGDFPFVGHLYVVPAKRHRDDERNLVSFYLAV